MIFKNEKGFTLIELMIVISIFAIITTALIASFSSQNNAMKNDLLSADMNQNLRAALYYMENEIIKAGFDPEAAASGPGGIPSSVGINTTLSDQTSLILSYVSDNDDIDNNLDGGVDEIGEFTTVRYSLSAGQIQRTENNTSEIVAENIDGLDFQYLPTPTNPMAIRVTILARTDTRLQGKNNVERTYTAPSGNTLGTGTYDDAFKRRMISSVIKCRNLSL